MASIVKAFLEEYFHDRDQKEQQFRYFTEDLEYDKARTAENIWGDKKFHEKETNMRHGEISEEDFNAALDAARKEFGEDLVALAVAEFDKEKDGVEKEEEEQKQWGEELKKLEESGKVYSRTEAGKYDSMVADLLPRLIKCNDGQSIIVHIPDEDMAKEGNLKFLAVKDEADEWMFIKKFSGDEDELVLRWTPGEMGWTCKMTPYACFGKYGMWKGDKVNQPWNAELHQDADADEKEMKEWLDEMEGKGWQNGGWTTTDKPIEPEEEWLSEDPALQETPSRAQPKAIKAR